MKQEILEIKKSKFIGVAENIFCKEDFEQIFEKLKKEHKKATHICFAYKFVQNGVENVKFSDDGEPTGMAGRPILGVIEKKDLNNVVVFVVRYFGGKKLGAGGLIRAYSKATSSVLKSDNN